MLQAFDGDGFERFFGQFNLELSVGCINLQDHETAAIGPTDVVFEIVNPDGSGSIHAPSIQGSVDGPQPTALFLNLLASTP